MKPSKQVKSAFKAFKAKSTTTNVSMKVWARNANTPGSPLGVVIQQWFTNKHNKGVS